MSRISAFGICILLLLFPAISNAQLSYADSGTGPLNTTPPSITDIVANPGAAQWGETVTITFAVSRALQGDPVVSVNGGQAVITGVDGDLRYACEYVVRRGDPAGTALISVTAVDTLGNEATASEIGPLVIKAMPLHVWTAFLMLLVVGALLAGRRRRTVAHVVVAVIGVLLPAAVFAVAPQVSNVRFIQGPDAAGGTKVDIYYDLVAPGHPCTISVSLSKNGGADGFSHPVSALSGDLLNVGTGQNHHIVWKISDDYPNEYIPEARIRVTADEVFSFVLMTDTHLGMKCSETNFRGISWWIVNQAAEMNIRFTGHQGDVCDNRTSTSLAELMPIARAALQPIVDSGIPLSVAIGNHDYRDASSLDPPRLAQAFNQSDAFGLDFYAGKPWFGGTFEEETASPGPYPGGTINHYITQEIAGFSFLFLTLEYYPRDKVLEWADNLVRNVYPNHHVIVITHAYLNENGALSTGSYASASSGPEFSNSGSNMWDRYFKNWENLRFILNGHFIEEPRQAYLEQAGVHGNIVHSYFFNYQNWGYRFGSIYPVTEGGLHEAATIRIFTIYPASNKVVVKGYTPSARTVIETALPESYDFIVEQ